MFKSRNILIVWRIILVHNDLFFDVQWSTQTENRRWLFSSSSSRWEWKAILEFLLTSSCEDKRKRLRSRKVFSLKKNKKKMPKRRRKKNHRHSFVISGSQRIVLLTGKRRRRKTRWVGVFRLVKFSSTLTSFLALFHQPIIPFIYSSHKSSFSLTGIMTAYPSTKSTLHGRISSLLTWCLENLNNSLIVQGAFNANLYLFIPLRVFCFSLVFKKIF